MIVQVNAGTSETDSPRWGKLRSWVVAFAAATAYDPHEHAAETIKQLRHSVTSLEARILELEKRDPT